MDEFLRGLQRQWGSTGSPDDGVEYLLALLKVQPVDLVNFPTDILRRANLLLTGMDRSSTAFRNQNLLYGVPINSVLDQLQELMQPYWEILQPAEGVPAFDRIAHWFAQNNLSEEQAAASQNVVGAPDDYDEYGDPFPGGQEYNMEDIIYDLIVWYPDVSEIRVFTASQYADTYGDILADFSEGYAQVPQNIPQPMGVLRKFVFRHELDGWTIISINVVAHQQGLWSDKPRAETFETLILTSAWRPYQTPLVMGNRRNYFVLIDEISPALPLNVAPHIERGRCEDYPACGHAEHDEYGSMRAFCPPRWSHTGRQVGMICAICGGEMPLGPSSIHPACMRRSIAQEDPYFYSDEEEYDEDGEPFENDRAWYEHCDDYGYRRNPNSAGDYATQGDDDIFDYPQEFCPKCFSKEMVDSGHTDNDLLVVTCEDCEYQWWEPDIVEDG